MGWGEPLFKYRTKLVEKLSSFIYALSSRAFGGGALPYTCLKSQPGLRNRVPIPCDHDQLHHGACRLPFLLYPLFLPESA